MRTSVAGSIALTDSPRRLRHHLITVAGLAVLLSELVFLGGAYFQGFFVADRAGHAIAND